MLVWNVQLKIESYAGEQCPPDSPAPEELP